MSAMMKRYLLIALLAVVSYTDIGAQGSRFFYPSPPPGSVVVSTDVPYDGRQMDVYRPRNSTGAALPGLIFFNIVSGAQRSNPLYKAWAEIAASKGFVAILPDLRNDTLEQHFDACLAHLASSAAALSIDPDRITVYAASGNVAGALPLVLDPRRTSVKAAAIYYGSAPVTQFRQDLPVLFVRAGLDRPPLNRAIAELVLLATSQNAPVTLLNYPGGHHGFEIADDEDASREVIDRTIDFLTRVTTSSYQASLRRGVPEATAAGHMTSGRFKEAATSYEALLKVQPDNARLRLSYGEALLAGSRFSEACAEFAKLKGKGLGPRDLGVPAARACMLKGDAEAAIEWLRSIPSRFLPRDLERDPIFAPIQSRSDFTALFQTR
jgi:dienelactone hydrolase